MGAKDTVMNDEQIEQLYSAELPYDMLYEDMKRILKAQAEISFKAGIQEVVEWIKQYSLIDPTDPTQYKSFRMNHSDWQAKLKEWGIR